MVDNRLQWAIDRHIVTTSEAAALGLFLTWGRHGFAVISEYGNVLPGWREEIWRVYSMSSWVCHDNETLIQGQLVTIGELTGVYQNPFVEIATAIQGPGVKARWITEHGIPVTHGVFVLYWAPIAVGDIIYTRIKYEVVQKINEGRQ